MSEVKNNFPKGSDIYIKCIHSKEGEYPLLKPEDDPMVLPKIGGKMGYLILQAKKSERESIPSKIDDISLEVTSVTSDEDVSDYEIVLKYGFRFLRGPYCHTIKAKKKENKSKDDQSTCQADVNVEIGPKNP